MKKELIKIKELFNISKLYTHKGKCGKRKLKTKYFGEYEHFPIETKIGLTNEQLLDYLK